MLAAINFFGVAVFAISGGLLGVRKNLDFFGIWLLAVFTGVGGGIMRDVFLGITPPSSVQNYQPIAGATLGCILVYFFHPRLNKLHKSILWFDAIGVGIFSASAVITAFHHHASSFAAVIVALVTAIGGGLMRDVLVNEVPLLLSQDFYALPAVFGSIATAAIFSQLGEGWAIIIGMFTTSLFRLLGVWRQWKLPPAPVDGVNLFKRFVYKDNKK